MRTALYRNTVGPRILTVLAAVFIPDTQVSDNDVVSARYFQAAVDAGSRTGTNDSLVRTYAYPLSPPRHHKHIRNKDNIRYVTLNIGLESCFIGGDNNCSGRAACNSVRYVPVSNSNPADRTILEC